MQDFVVDFYKTTNVIDIVYLVITIFTLIGCYKRGFVLSILSMAKWFLAYIITLIIFPKAKPYLKGIVDNEYVLDVVLGVTIFVIVIFSSVTSLLTTSTFANSLLSVAFLSSLEQAVTIKPIAINGITLITVFIITVPNSLKLKRLIERTISL